MNILFILFIFLFMPSLYANTNTLNKMVIFGDSLSDNGNLYEYMHKKIPQSPPYYKGRFSNGLVWVEYLIQSYYPQESKSHLLNYAFGGAGISGESDEDILFTLKREIDTYFLMHQNKADENSLYVIWIGANNYLGIPDDSEQTLTTVSDGLRNDLQRLVKGGAKHILVINLPDLGLTPLAVAFNAQEKLSYLAKRHNELLEKNISDLSKIYTDVQWLFFDVNQTLNELIAFPSKYGFSNIVETCYEANLTTPSKTTVFSIVTNLRKKTTNDPCNGYLFFDPIHPTAQAHQIVGREAKLFLDRQGIHFSNT